MTHLIRMGPPLFVDAPKDVHVAEPPLEGQCWGLKRHGRWTKPCRCDRHARRDRLTCNFHHSWEPLARALKARLQAERFAAWRAARTSAGTGGEAAG